MIKQTVFFILLLSTSCITFYKTESSKADDGSSSISKQDSLSLHEFSGAENSTVNRSDLFEFISANQLKSIAIKNQYTIVVLWASWCPICHDYLPKLNLWQDSITSLKKNIGITLISQNINISYSQTILTRYNYPYQSYILDPRLYGSNERTKQDKFLAEFITKHQQTNGAVPRTLLLDKNGNIIVELSGKKITLNQLMSYMKV